MFIYVCCRSCRDSFHHYDSLLRLSVFSGDIEDETDAEAMLHGYYGQIEVRCNALLRTLSVFMSFSAKLGQINPNIRGAINAARNALIIVAVQSLNLLMTASLISYKICCDSTSLSTCFRLCNNFLPILMKNVSDPLIILGFLQKHIDVMTLSLLLSDCPVNLSSTSNRTIIRNMPSNAEIRLLTFSLGEEVMRYSLRHAWNGSDAEGLTGIHAVHYHEVALRSYISIFQLVAALDDSDFLSVFGFDEMTLFTCIYNSVSKLADSIQKSGCFLLDTYTLISLHNFVDTCLLVAPR